MSFCASTSGERVGFLDWACTARGPGLRDVSYFLCNSTPTELRRREERALLQLYLDGLAKRGVDAPSPGDAFEQHRRLAVYSWVAAAATAAVGDRMQPIAVGRRAMADISMGGYTVRRGTIVLASQYLLHHDARFFPDPQTFDPDRWLPERQVNRPKYAYFPFGAGNRVCIGESFAWTEGILVLATLARTWRLERLDDEPVPMRAGITLRPARPIRVRARRRSL